MTADGREVTAGLSVVGSTQLVREPASPGDRAQEGLDLFVAEFGGELGRLVLGQALGLGQAT